MTPLPLRPVTLVIPMYGDLPSLERSVKSVLDTVDLSVHSLLLVNDCGPEVEAIEASVLALIAGTPNATYFRNEKNLGFVLTCNRAVFELDKTGNDILLLNSDARLADGAFAEMVAVLALNEKHGVVFPRSDNASIASVPLAPVLADEPIGSESASLEIYEGLRRALPRFTITPIAVGFCFLVRRELVDNYGFFDEIYSPGYSEENDFCLRVNRFGYSSVMANGAFAFHEGSKSFGSADKIELMRQHEEVMLGRYGYYDSSVVHYLQWGVNPIDWFADRLFGSGRKRILIDLHHMSLIYNGSTRNALSFLELLAEKRDELDADVVVVSSGDAIEFFDLESYGFEVVVNGALKGTFDLGFALSPVSFPTQIHDLNRFCARWVVSHFDIIALRINSLLEVSYSRRQIVLDSLRFADRIIPISQASLDDVDAFFGLEATGVRERSTVIHEGVADSSLGALGTAVTVQAVREPGYVLVIGNVFSHKQFPEALTALAGLDRRIVAFGAFATEFTLAPNTELVEGGLLSDDEVDLLYRDAACVVFPSSYEGFGLPIAETAQRGRSLVLFDTQVGREVVDSLGIADRTWYFTRMRQLPEMVETAIRDAAAGIPELRPLRAYNEGILEVLKEELVRPVDLDRLSARVAHFRAVEIYRDVVEQRLNGFGTLLDSRSVQLALKASALLQPLRPAVSRVLSGARGLRNALSPRRPD